LSGFSAVSLASEGAIPKLLITGIIGSNER
jgi:hypothetical protein